MTASGGPPAQEPSIIDVARHALEHEASTIRAVSDQLDERFVRAVECIARARGRVIVTGLGKSGLVGLKIAATMSSLGSPAHFVHSTDALHGDAGVLLAEDVLIAISNSGESDEVIGFAKMARARGADVIALTGVVDSALASVAVEVIVIPIEREADPHDLAPTASTTATMAVGDALSIALMTASGFDRDSFLINHPGGSIGRASTDA